MSQPPAPIPPPTSAPPPAPARRRDAARTRQLLLDVARVRFMHDGYAATTVRDIADDAGVNVALINRYFTSKEGLFEACLTSAASDLSHDADTITRDELVARIVERLVGTAGDASARDAYLMLLRTSGDERIDDLRRAELAAHSHKLAAATGQTDLIRSQLVLATTLGLALLRSSIKLEPLASATEQELTGPLSDVIDAALPRA